MGVDIHVKITKYNEKTGIWEQINLYQKDEKGNFSSVSPYPFRNSELFGILSDEHDDHFPIHTLTTWTNYDKETQEEFELAHEDFGYYGWGWFNLAEVDLYLQKHPKVRDWDYEEDDFEENGWKNNPVKYFIDLITAYLDLADPYWDWDGHSNIRVILWYDR